MVADRASEICIISWFFLQFKHIFALNAVQLSSFFSFLFAERKWIVFAVFLLLFLFLFGLLFSVSQLYCCCFWWWFFFLFSFYDYLFCCYLFHCLTCCFHRKTEFVSLMHHNANASLFNALVVVVVVVFGSFLTLASAQTRSCFLSVIQMKILVEQTNERNNKNNTNTHIKRIGFNG